MHHNFAWSLDLLKRIKSDVVQVASAVKISFFVSHNLFEKDVTSSFSLLLFQKQVVGRCNLIMFIILNICYSLI